MARSRWGTLAPVAGVLTMAARVCTAARAGGEALVNQNGTVFVAKHCFTFNASEGVHHAGVVDLHVKVAPGSRPWHKMYFLLFDDEEMSYPGPSAEWDRLSCDQKAARARSHTFIDFAKSSRPQGFHVKVNVRQKIKPRWWYTAFTECSPQRGAPSGDATEEPFRLTYDAHFTNPVYGWAEEFSTDQRFALHLFVPLTVAFALLFAAQIYANRSGDIRAKDDCASAKAAHPFTRLLTCGVLLALCDVSLWTLQHLLFAYSGTGNAILRTFAQLFSVAANFLLASMLLLIAQGKCISYMMVAADAHHMLRLLGPFLAGCFALELWGDHAMWRNYTTSYVYTTTCGWALIVVDLFILAIYSRSMRTTYLVERGREDAKFYRTWGVAYGIWFLALPLSAILAQVILAPYAWFMVTASIKRGCTLALYATLVVGVWPGNTRTPFKLEPELFQAQFPRLLERRNNSGPLKTNSLHANRVRKGSAV